MSEQNDRDRERPTIEELIEALEAPGPLADQPAVKRLIERTRSVPTLTLIHGGASDA